MKITSINSLPFAQLKNAEHVAFFNNVVLELSKFDVTDLGLTAEKLNQFKDIVNKEQDIVLKAQGSMYTKDMQALDEERDRLYRMIRLKMQAICLASPDSPLATYKPSLEKYILSKYNNDITALPYQEESAHLSGFDLDLHAHFTDEELEFMAIAEDLNLLKTANNTFADMYNQRATERAGSTTELTKKLRAESEELYAYLRLHIEYMANTAPETEKGMACLSVIGVINEYVKDARYRLYMRLGKVEPEEELGDDISPIPYPNK